MGDQPSITRRGVLVGAGAVAGMFAVGGAAYALEGEDRGLLRPPGAQDEAHFRATCLKCNRCETACPQHCLRTGVLEDGLLNWRTPIMDFHRGVCDFCGICEDVCPAGSIAGAHDPAQVGVAVVDRERCIAWAQGGCQVCVDACPYGAIALDDANDPLSTRRNATDAARARTHARRTATSRSPAAPTAASTCTQQGRRHRR